MDLSRTRRGRLKSLERFQQGHDGPADPGVLISAYADTVLATPGLVNFWTLDGAATDLKGSAPVTYGTAVQPAQAGRVVGDLASRFVRASYANSYVTSNPPNLAGAHSIELVFKIPALAITSGWYVFGTRNGTSDPLVTTDFHIQPTGQFWMNLGNGTTVYSSGVIGSAVTRDVWHHLIAAVGADGSWQVFLDGASAGTGTWSLSGTPLMFDATRKLVIGNYSRSTFDPNYAYEGLFTELAVYNVKLSAATAAAHVAALGPEPTIVYRPGPRPFKTETVKAARTYLAVPAGHSGGSGGVRPAVGQIWPRGNP